MEPLWRFKALLREKVRFSPHNPRLSLIRLLPRFEDILPYSLSFLVLYPAPRPSRDELVSLSETTPRPFTSCGNAPIPFNGLKLLMSRLLMVQSRTSLFLTLDFLSCRSTLQPESGRLVYTFSPSVFTLTIFFCLTWWRSNLGTLPFCLFPRPQPRNDVSGVWCDVPHRVDYLPPRSP